MARRRRRQLCARPLRPGSLRCRRPCNASRGGRPSSASSASTFRGARWPFPPRTRTTVATFRSTSTSWPS
eukprot:9881492-Lingulodinium_polyedra.AAC.1